MSNDKMERLRCELNQLISEDAPFDEIQRVSQLLDACLVDYYNEHKKRE